MTEECRLYLDYALRDLQAAESNLNLGFYHITISRAYYAMFYAASALLASKGIARSKHSGMLSAFGEQFVRTGLIEPEYAKMLGHAFDSRLDSDYDVIYAAEPAVAEDILKAARHFVARAERYLEQESIRDNAN